MNQMTPNLSMERAARGKPWAGGHVKRFGGRIERGDGMVEELKEKGTSEVLKKLKEMRKSAKDKKIAGICGGFGEYTPLPSWLWRVVFLTSLFVGGVGLIAYIILWICMPSAKTDQ